MDMNVYPLINLIPQSPIFIANSIKIVSSYLTYIAYGIPCNVL